MRATATALPLVLVPAGLLAAGAPPAAAATTQAPLVLQASTTTTYLGTTVNLSATGGSGTGTVFFQVPDTLVEPQCLLTGSTLQTGGDPTTCDVQAVKLGDSQYATTYSDPVAITFTQRVQAPLVVTSTAGALGTPLTLAASGGSTDAPVTFTTQDGTASGCTVGGSGSDILTSSTAGTCIVTAAKAGSSFIAPYYADATSAPTAVTFVSGNQLVVTSTSGLSSQPLTLATVGGTGTGAVTYTVMNGSATNCAVSATAPYTLSGQGGGTCVVTATKAGDGTRPSVTSAATAVTLLVPQSMPLQIAGTIWNSGYPMPLATLGGNSGGEVTYQVDPSPGCVLSTTAPYTLSNPSGGVCTVTATRGADGTWAAESSAPTMIQFSDTMPVVTATSLTAGFPTDLSVVGGATRDVTTFSDAGGDCNVDSSWGGGYQATGVMPGGTCLLRITQNDYNLPTITWPVIALPILRNAQASLTITSTSGNGGSPLALTTTGGSGDGRTTYTAADGTASGCSISLTLPYTLTASSAGTCTVTATKAGDPSYTPISSAPTTVALAKAGQAPLTVTSTTGTYGSPLTLTTSGGSGSGAVTYATTDGTASTCTVTGNTLTASSAGTCQVTAAKAGDAAYNDAVSAPTTVTFAKQATSLALKHDPALLAGSTTSLSVTLSNSSGAGIAGKAVTLGIGTGTDRRTCTATTTSDGTGTCVLTTSTALGPEPVDASFAGDADHLGATTTDSVVTYGLSSGGTFVIGDEAGVQGSTVTFWGSSWSTANPLTSGTAPTRFKGFASKESTAGWSTGTGPTGEPPASVPAYLLVDVTSSVGRSGSTYSGDVVHRAVVRVDAGYGAKNNQTGTGAVAALLG